MQNGSGPENAKSRKNARRAGKSGDGAVATHNANVSCWNSQHGCTFKGAFTSVAQHLEQGCRFHEITCAVCHVRVLQMHISKHLRTECSKGGEAAGGSAAASVSTESASTLRSTATVSSPGCSPLTVGDVDRAFTELKEMFAACTAQQLAVVETRVNELSEKIASLGNNLLNDDESESPETTDSEGHSGDPTENELPDSLTVQLGVLSEEIATLRAAVLKSADAATKKTAKLQEQFRRCAQKEGLNVLESKVNELREIVRTNNARLLMNTADIQARCELLTEESSMDHLTQQVYFLTSQVDSSKRTSFETTSKLQQELRTFFEQYRKDKVEIECGIGLVLLIMGCTLLLKLFQHFGGKSQPMQNYQP